MRSLTIFDVTDDFRIMNFPLGETKEFSEDQTLFKEYTPVTTVAHIGSEEIVLEIGNEQQKFNFYKFDIIHEVPRKVWGRFEGKEFHMFFERVRVAFWIDDSAKIAIAAGRTKLCKDVIHRVPLLHLKEKYLDLKCLKASLSEQGAGQILGAVFKNLNLRNVDTAIIYGSDVEESEEYEKYDAAGEISALIISIDALGETIRVGNRWNIGIYSYFPQDREYIERVLEHRSWIQKLCPND